MSHSRPALHRLPIALAALLAMLFGLAPPAGAERVVALGDHHFTLPDGYTIERAAGPPLVDRPITADFDERGRLYVAESSGSNDPVQTQLKEKPHRILRLEDTDHDGTFDRRTVFADRMMFPEGTLWHDGSLYVSAPPQIWKLTDTDDDGVADRREIWFDGETLTGCANDLHGPYLGPDGWIYWCKGAFAEQTYERPDGDPFVTRASHIFRWRPDRKGVIEPVMTGGMDNPVDVVFTPGGERIFSTTFLQHPAGGRRDGLIHALYGGVYGKVHDVINDHPWTSPEVLPVLTHLGPAAACGLERYRGDALGPDFQNNLFACCFNLRKVTRHILKPDGASFQTIDSDFVVSDNTDFHPTDVLEDADGSLLVIDTGGWYKLCCPTSQFWKPDVLGAIYRIRRIDAPAIDDPRGLALPWDGPDAPADALADRLDDPRPAVRDRAIEALAHLGAEAVPALESVVRDAPSAESRRNAVWAASRIDDPSARSVAHFALEDEDEDETVRQAALHAISVRRDPGAMEALYGVLQFGSLPNRRAAAEALGRIGDPAATLELIRSARDVSDRALHHSITYALIEINDPDNTRFGLQSPHDSVRRAALIALDQMPGDHLEPSDVTPLLSSSDALLREAASWVASRHPEWGKALSGYFRSRLNTIGDEPDTARDSLVAQLARLSPSPDVQRVLADVLADGPTPARRVALRVMARSDLETAPASWVEAVTSILQNGDEHQSLIGPALTAARLLSVPDDQSGALRTVLLQIARDGQAPVSRRLDALSALPQGPGALPSDVFTFLIDRLDPDQPANDQSRAADLLAAAVLTDEQLASLADHLPEVGPLALPRLLPAFARSKREEIGILLVKSLMESPSRSVLRPGNLRDVLAHFGPKVQDRAESLLAAIDADAEQKRARLESLLSLVEQGDIREGQAVFNSEKAACRTCHAIGYVGGRVGPDLTRIGRTREKRDLLEAIVYPSASFVRSYEPVLVALTDGRVVSGILTEDSPDRIVLTVNADETVRIPRDQIEAMRPGDVSVMPAGLDQQLTPEELADLVTFLKACQ